MDLDPGTVVANRYRIGRPLGRGGMGEVFAAENIRTGRPVAIKLLRQDSKQKSSAVARFRQEARAAGSINSDHVTQVLDVEEDAEHGVVLVFELLEGESLIDRLKRTGPIPFEELWSIIEQVWMGLADAHRAGIIHRDLKPSNVFLEHRPDGTTRVKILDFGISKVPKEAGGETLTEMGQSLGTFSFMPPEQIGKAKTVDHRADVYACATLIYQSLTGQLPYAARNVLIMVEMKTKTDARSLREAMGTSFDPRLEAFVACGLARDPSRRFQTAASALAAWRDLRPMHGPSMGLMAPPPPKVEGPRSAIAVPAHLLLQDGSSGSRRPSQPRMPAAQPSPVIFEKAGPLPRMNADPMESTSDEGAATIAMPLASLKGGSPAHAAHLPRTPGVHAAQSQGVPSSVPGSGPRGTHLVASGNTNTPSSTSPALSSAMAMPASVAMAPQQPQQQPMRQPMQRQASQPPVPPTTPYTPASLPRAFVDDPPSSISEDIRTQLYRPRDESSKNEVDPAAVAAAGAPKRSVPLVLVLVGFLLVGFAAVAGLMHFVR